jgi:hypothetical protein
MITIFLLASKGEPFLMSFQTIRCKTQLRGLSSSTFYLLPGIVSSVGLLLAFLFLTHSFAEAEPPATLASKTTPDIVVFTNGDRLTGHMVQVIDNNVTFHSDIVGDVTIPWAKIKSLQTQQQFAVIEKDERLTRKSAADKVTLGSVSVENNHIQISPPAGSPKIFPTNNTDSIVDAATLHREITDQSNILYGWNGNITLGASLVQATNTSQTYTGAVQLVRAIPTVSWLPPTSRTSLNLSGTYGLLTQPQILVNGDLIQAASIAKTNILHGDTEYDRYISSRVFWLGTASADHNFGSGLQLQQTYGLGFGWTAVKSSKQTLDLKTDLHYEQQQFYNGVVSGLGTPNANLIGTDLSETWTRTLAHDVKLTQNLTLTPAFNVVQASSAVANASIIFPVYKKLSFNLSSTDNYLGDPPVGYQRNSFQFTAGITYLIK